jgi:hypothetical protein
MCIELIGLRWDSASCMTLASTCIRAAVKAVQAIFWVSLRWIDRLRQGTTNANGQLAEGFCNPASCIYAHRCTSLHGCNRVVFCVVCFCTIPCWNMQCRLVQDWQVYCCYAKRYSSIEGSCSWLVCCCYTTCYCWVGCALLQGWRLMWSWIPDYQIS